MNISLIVLVIAGLVGVLALAVVGILHYAATRPMRVVRTRTYPRSRRFFITLLVVMLVAVSLTACGGEGACEGLNDVDCNTPGVQTAGQSVVEDILNSAANANGDGQVDTAPCGGIVCP